MSLILSRAKAFTATTGTGTITLGAAVAPFRTWALAGASGTTRRYSYLIEDTGNAWEIGEGVYDSGAGTLTRTLVASSTGSLLNLTGSATVSSVQKSEDVPQLVEKVSLNGLATYTFSDIPQTHSGLKLIIHGANLQAALGANPTITVNSLGTGIYSTQRQYSQSTSNTADQSLLATSLGALFSALPGTTAPANTSGYMEIDFFEYRSSVFRKVGKFVGRQAAATGTTAAFHLHASFEINLTAAITSLTINANAGGANFKDGSTASLTLIP